MKKFLNKKLFIWVFLYAQLTNAFSYNNTSKFLYHNTPKEVTYWLPSSDGRSYTIKIVQGDLLTLHTTESSCRNGYTIVNPANKRLTLGGGVAGAIFMADQSGAIQKECDLYLYNKNIDKLPVGTTVLTTSGSLKKTHSIAYIIHAVGPDCRNNKEEADFSYLLQKTYEHIFKAATDFNSSQKSNNDDVDIRINTVACPSISTGIFAAPVEKAATIASHTIVSSMYKYARSGDNNAPTTFIMTTYSDKDFEVYKEAFAQTIQQQIKH